jgi:hypothetical protein
MLRRLAIILLFLAAPLSGGLAAAAQVRDLAANATVAHHHHHRMAPVTHDHASAKPDADCEDGEQCGDPAKAVHPFLCSACIAICAAQIGVTCPARPSARLSPDRHKELRALHLKPRSPPPKSVLSI